MEYTGKELYKGRFRILRKIGEGGSSRAYEAYDDLTGKNVTVKLQKEGSEALVAADAAEAFVLKDLDHPAIPKVVAAFEDSIILDFFPGNTLQKALASNGYFSEKQGLLLGEEILDVLEYLHSRPQPVIYRDLKPANIILTPSGHIALIDFGAARIYDGCEKADTANLGTRGYAAPEQYGSLGQTDKRTDIYCFGITLKTILGPNASPETKEIIFGCTRPDRQERFSDCSEIKTALLNARKKRRIRKAKAVMGTAFGAAALSLALTLGITGYAQIRDAAREDARLRMPAVRERLGNAGVRLQTVLGNDAVIRGRLLITEILEK